MQSIHFDDYKLSSESAFNYVTHKMIEMIEQEREMIKDLSSYRWVIGCKVANYIFPKHPTKIFDYDVVYEDPVVFYPNGINFEPGIVNTKNCSNCRFGNDGICPKINVCVKSTLNPAPSHWAEMTAAQKLEKEMSNTKTDKKLVGNISSGYSYVDTDITCKIEDDQNSYKHILNKVYGREPFDLSLNLKRIEQFCDLYGIDFRIIPDPKVYTFKFIKKSTFSVYRVAFNCLWSEMNQELLQDMLIEKLKRRFILIRDKKENIKPVTKYNEMFKKEDKNMSKLFIAESKGVWPDEADVKDLIKNVIFSGPCTIVQWSDGDKTIVRCENDDFDKEKGLAMAIVKKFFGTNESKSNYNDIFKKWIPDEDEVFEEHKEPSKEIVYMNVTEYANFTCKSKSTVRRLIYSGKISGAKKDDTGKWLIPVNKEV